MNTYLLITNYANEDCDAAHKDVDGFNAPDDASAIEQVRGRINSSASPEDFDLYRLAGVVDLSAVVGPAMAKLDARRASIQAERDGAEYERLRQKFETQEVQS